ncbi:hypothetical protein VSR01_28325 [Actinacidiphila sp. DG2A-62]|uniref:hypothetical protein n=1 Tax=Actinacidiphila sp. DG2A-62 TaxID=3108821 RepID=UPI002DBDC093|nr:hypothetical protein [Actinacidiphila sp. DG2A-62]MEC3997197.1 hypothetical protein [Actinacidiphila sp. DG2A-62]
MTEFTALDAGVLLGGLLERERSVREARELTTAGSVWGLERLWGTSSPSASAAGAGAVVTGARRIQQALAALGASASTTRMSLLPEPVPVRHTARAVVAGGLVERGVRVREIFRTSCEASPAQAQSLHRLTEVGVEIRLAAVVPIAMMIIDSRLVVLPLYPDHPSAAVIVCERPALAWMAERIFQDTWAGAQAPPA